ncbi:MAG: PD-(D/E)XK nuclease-like domain-containing protein [Candidatus Sabulitectum sp.]|nr:PD-(D/E)XK nuclease-like domain-containing protein [Candidatus Sabulitectum sp.]
MSKVFEPGRYQDVPEDVYHQSAGISKSMLSKMDCPVKLLAPPKPPTPAMIVGSAVHHAILEPDKFNKLYAKPLQLPTDIQVVDTVAEMKDILKQMGIKATGAKAALMDTLKAADGSLIFLSDLKAEQESANIGKIVITDEAYDKALRMRDSVHSHPQASELLGMCKHFEESHYWIDERTGELCKARTDAFASDNCIIDLKKVANASPWGFSKALWDYKYHWQDAWYSRGTKADNFFFICVEDDGPSFVTEVYCLTERDKCQGQREVDAALDKYMVCRDLDDWPSYNDNDRINMIELPRYAQVGGITGAYYEEKEKSNSNF